MAGADGTPGFREWLVSRSGALTRFGYVLTGQQARTDQVLHEGLVRAAGAWSRIGRGDDPESEVRRLVALAYVKGGRSTRGSAAGSRPTAEEAAASSDDPRDLSARVWAALATLEPPERAAVVLRCYSDMTVPQVAASLDRRDRTAAALLASGLGHVASMLPPAVGSDRVEEAIRDSLLDHAEQAEDTEGRANPALVEAARRRRSRFLVGTAAAVAVVAAVVVIGQVADKPEQQVEAVPGAHPPAWRPESYRGVQLWVPTSWGWGAVPSRAAPAGTVCGARAFSPTVAQRVHFPSSSGTLAPYVGRPLGPEPNCAPAAARSNSHVWFDSPLPVGETRGQTTVTVRGVRPVRITVADRDAEERAKIVASITAELVDENGCPRDFDAMQGAEAASRAQPAASVRSLSLCLFSSTGGGPSSLFYSTSLDGPNAVAAVQRIQQNPTPGHAKACLLAPTTRNLTLIARSKSGISVFGMNAGLCPGSDFGFVTGSAFHALTPRSLALWATDGLSVYAGGPLSSGGSAAGPGS